MNVSLPSLAMLLALSHPIGTHAQEASTPQVQVTGVQSDTDARREFVAGKIVIGRKRIEDSGVRKVEDLLKREPSVTVGSDGRIGLLNLPGYTQLLIDGQPPVGKSPGEMDLVHVERVEIVKSSMAEYGPFGIAGTINIVTRKTSRKTETDVSAGVANTGSRPRADIALSHNVSPAGSPFRYSVQLSADSSNGAGTSSIWQTITLPGQQEREQWRGFLRSEARRPSVSATAGIVWQRSADETVQFSPDVSRIGGRDTDREARTWIHGAVDTSLKESRTTLHAFGLPLTWAFKPTRNSQLELRANGNMVRLRVYDKRGDEIAGTRHLLDTESDTTGRSSSLDLMYKARLANGHDLKLGTTLRRTAYEIDRYYTAHGRALPAFAAVGTSSDSRIRELRLYIQDEWRVNDKTSLNGGLSAQQTRIVILEDLYRGQTRFQLWSPSLHVSRKLGADSTRQLRFSVARSFRAPDSDALTTHPVINSWAPCPAAAACGANTFDTPDRSGNSALRPERALALNASYERGFGDDSQITFEIFSRRFHDKFGMATALDSVPWASVPRYVERQFNVGKAYSSGVNVEMELALRDLLDDAPKLAIRGSAHLARSRVPAVPGPDNVLDKQSPWSAKLGGTYALGKLPLTIDLDASWKPAASVRTSWSERVSRPRYVGLDASAKWKFAQGQNVVISWKSSVPRLPRTRNEYIASDYRLGLYHDTPKPSTIRIQFESSL